MDFDFFREEEQFSNFLNSDHYSDFSSLEEHNLGPTQLFEFSLGNEIELNGDLSLISSDSFCDITSSSRGRHDFQKIMNDWQQLVDLDSNCDDFAVDVPVTDEDDDILNASNLSSFDIATYIKEDSPEKRPYVSPRKPRAGVKKIDHKARRYITQEEEDEIDVETISECGENNSPVLEAGDVNSLLEQFEATELPCLSTYINTGPTATRLVLKNLHKDLVEQNFLEDSKFECKPEMKKENEEVVNIKSEPVDSYSNIVSSPITVKEQDKSDIKKSKRKNKVDVIKKECVDIKNECVENTCLTVSDARITEVKKEPLEPIEKQKDEDTVAIEVEDIHISKIKPATKDDKCFIKDLPEPCKRKQVEKTTPAVPQNTPHTTSTPPEIKHKQIVNSLPQELINKIRESGKRKPISVIPPIAPNKKPRLSSKVHESTAQPKKNKIVAADQPRTVVQLDHDYCSKETRCYNQKKDSGFESAEEEEQRTVIAKQPMIKNVDGRMMVSLLKVNTIRSEQVIKKRKLNLEEYKKRREGVLKSQSNSQTSSPLSSNCSSPLPEDENAKLKKHQEKLMRMAMEVLNTPAKSEKKIPTPVVVKIPKRIKIPPGMEKKTLVSIGVNTELKPRKNLDPLAPVEQLEQIKPLLKQASDKINCNSLITSLIENIPKVINSCSPQTSSKEPSNKVPSVHGEDKTIVYLPKERPPRETRDVETQTNISLIQQTKASRYRRRRLSSSSSCSSNNSRDGRASSHSNRSCKTSEDSRCSSRSSSRSSRSTSRVSSTSSYSSRLSSKSRSRSRSRSSTSSQRYNARKRREQERYREVEERRVIYVGRLASSTIKDDLRKRFQKFGPITNISLHSRDRGDNYGFVTFANKLDAYEAIEHGNDDPYYPKYDLSFGGRRIFCQTSYSDLDNVRDDGYYAPQRAAEESFDSLLREMQEKLRKRRV